MYRHFLKRFFDILLSAVAFVLLIVPMAVFALIIRIDSPGPALYWQKRIGINKTTFMMPKFRTMRSDAPTDIPTHLFNDSEKWITKCGRWMRKLSIDELPQIVCVFSGKMSFVGPRPALWNQEDLIEARDKYGANDVRPGLTGWAQINGRDELEIEEKAQLDGYYVKNYGFKLDARCVLYTITSGLCYKGVIEGGTGVKKR